MSRHELRWSHGRAVVDTTAAMLSDVEFLVGETGFRPFAAAHWSPDDAAVAGLPGHLRHLGAEFVCLPFGEGGRPDAVAEEWDALIDERRDAPAHGLAADAEWQVIAEADDRIALRLEYPDDGPVAAIERRIVGIGGEAALALELRIESRADGAVPVALHPILRLPERAGGLVLHADFDEGMTHPAAGGPLQRGAVFGDLCTVPVDGGVVDLSRLPLPRGASDADVNVQLCGVRGPIRAEYAAEGMMLEIDWDRRILPAAHLWLSDRALPDAPWSGRYRGLGIEPVAAAFDLAAAVSIEENPLTLRGHRTAVRLGAGIPVMIGYTYRAYKVVF